MDKVCHFFDKDFEYFLDAGMTNNVNENHGQVGQIGTVNNFPQNFLEEFKKLIEDNKNKEDIITELKNKLNSED